MPALPSLGSLPQPPTRFRCNRSRMILNIKITLHHISANQINLKTSRSKIELDTAQAHRKFFLSREYPRGIECDDSKTTARLEHGCLVVEMPITKLPAVMPNAKGAKQEAEPKEVGTSGKKRKLPREVPGGAATSMEEGTKRPGGGVHGSGKLKKRLRMEAEASEAAAAERASEAPGRRTQKPPHMRVTSSSTPSASSEETQMLKALSEAVGSEDARRQQLMAKMKKVQDAEVAAREHKQAKEAERQLKKQQLLESFKKQKLERKEAAKSEKAQAVPTKDKKGAAKKKRVSFSTHLTDA
ncbi:hypothetical protein AB1Y20_009361 [Prymnesium parvum]|uniref:SHSP domain-containing protein n=1 Tax=Prymnesium parvum TaxID=97485 RepID=A0AB34K1U6_PRYPA